MKVIFEESQEYTSDANIKLEDDFETERLQILPRKDSREDMYQRLIKSSKIDNLFEELLNEDVFQKQIKNSKKIIEGKFQENCKYCMTMADPQVNGVRHHEA